MNRKIVGTLLFSVMLSFADQITIVGDAWPPYNTETPDKDPGYAVEIAKEAFSKKGHTVKYEIVPWTRALDGTVSGKYTGAIGAFDGDVKGGVLPEESIGINQNTFFTKKGEAWKFTGIPSLEGKQLGLIKDYTYDKGAFDAWAAKSKTVQWASGEGPLLMNLKKMGSGRIDILLEDPNVVHYVAKQNGMDGQIQEVGALSANNPIFIAFSPSNPKSKEYAKILSDGIKEMRKSGQLKTILAKYNVKDWK